MTAPGSAQVFASAVVAYRRAGWPAILPVPSETKSPPPIGFTGEHGDDTSPEQLAQWATNGFADYSIALRMPDGVIGIDVDHYVKAGKQKVGADTLAGLEQQWGALPATWCSTARGNADGPGPSRIMLFRVPVGRYRTKFTDVEIIQRHHRYAVVPPSPHESIGAAYRWYRPDGSQAAEGEVPSPEDLPLLPEAWVAGLREGAAEAGPLAADVGSGASLLALLQDDRAPACSEMTDAALSAERVLRSADSGSRHDTMIGPVYRVVMLGASGHPGTGAVLAFLQAVWEELTAGENRGDEYERIMLTAARKAVTKVGATPVPSDPCLMFGGFEVPAPAPADNRPEGTEGRELLGPIGDPVPYSWRHVIGTELFDPQADLDQTLADEVLVRTWPMLRHASDSGGWLQRGPVQWELHKDLTRRAVSEVAKLMPKGDPGPPDKPPTPEQRQFARRKRMFTNASAGAVSKSITALVTGGFHPNAVKLAELDADPEILWAGGMAYDLRASAEGPAFAQVHQDMPHLMSAGVRPELIETPTWDRFIAQVWPDPEIRAWALRVLSIAVTGHPDAALPILMGDGGTGKTSTIELLMSLLGSYAHAADPRLLGDHTGHASIVFALKGRRLSFIDEGPREGRWAQERLKQLTGGGRLTANAMNQNPITFRPTHTLVLTANTEPVMTDEAVRRRARIIPCTGDPAAVRAARSALTPAAWRTEAPGVLAVFMREAAAWLAEPDSALTAAAPVSIRGIADDLATEQDPTTRWVEDMCEPWEVGTKVGDLRRAFIAWCRDMNIKIIPNDTVWGRKLTDLGFPREHRRDGKYRPMRVRRGGGDFEQMFPVPGPGDRFEVPGDRLVTGSEGNRSHPETPSSTPVFPSSVTGVTGSLSILMGERERDESIQNAKNTAGRELGSNRSQAQANPAPDLRVPGSANRSPEPVTSDLEPAGGQLALVPSVSSPSVDKPKEPTNAEVAARAYQGGDEKKISKAEARAQLKEEARRAAILESSGGEPVSLPVAVNRLGGIFPMSIEDAMATVRALIVRDGALTVDVETTGYPIGHADYALRTVQLGAADIAIVFDPIADADAIRALLAEAPKLHAYSATADLVPLADAGLVDAESVWDRMWDTMLPAKLIDIGSTTTADGLKPLATSVLGADAVAPTAEEARKAVFKAGRWLENTKVDTPIERSGWAQIDPGSPVMLRYAASDVLDTAAVQRALPSIPDAVMARERLAQRLTARVSHRGVRLDYDHVRRMTAEHTTARAEFDVKVRELLGVENPGSDPQIAKALLRIGAPVPISDKGNPSATKEVLGRMLATEFAEVAQAVLDFRHHDTVIGTFLRPYATLCERGDGRARPTIYTMGTNTGRMSCVRPNLQQLPREGGTRACIVADPGQLMIGADFSGVEIRVAAALSQDLELLKMLAEGRDLHWEIARMVWGESATKAHRYRVKPIVFGRFYGGGVSTLAGQAGLSESITQSVVDSLDTIAPGLAAWSTRIRQAARQGDTRYRSYSGRIIHLPRERSHAAGNYAIQGTARELLIDALESWSKTRWGNATILPVHDEVDAFVPAEEAEEATAALMECMSTTIYGVDIVAEPSKPSAFWADSV